MRRNSIFVRHVEYYLFGSGCYRRGSLIVRDAPNGTNVGTVSNGSTQLLKKYSSSVQWYQINDSTSSLDGNYVDASYVKLGSPY